MRTYSSGLKIASGLTLAFFLWSFGPVYAPIAWAAAPEGQGSSSKRQVNQGLGAGSQGPGNAGERFEKALESIRENISIADEKAAKDQDITAEVAEVKKQRTEIEKIDIELRKEFAATEKKLKDANLPKEILSRHYKFVKHYSDNLKQLKAEITGIEKAKTKSARKLKIEQAKAHLDQVKPPKKHVPLDPNKLPFRTVKAKERAPRLKKEEFERDFPLQKKQKLNFTAEVAEDAEKRVASWYGVAAEPVLDLIGDFSLRERTKQKRILVASNGPLTGLLSSSVQSPLPLGDNVGSVPEWLNRGMRGGFDPVSFAVNDLTLNSELGTQNYEVALVTADTPTAADLAETPDIQFTDAIRAKAQELGGNPVKIYEWVRNNIEYAPTYGSIQGADQCLQAKICNDMDTASLLIALLRVSGIYSHYVYGTIEIPIAKEMNWTGGFSDSVSALNYIASGGVSVTGLRSGGNIYAARMEHVWVKAFIDYIPSMGAVHKQGDTWIPLDASYKQYTYTDGVDFATVVPFDGKTLADQIKATATINEQESYVTNVDSTLIQAAQNDYNTQLENYVNQNMPDATPGDIFGKKEIIKKEQPILPASLPFKMVVAGTESSEVPDQLRHKIMLQLSDADNPGSPVISYTARLPQLSGKRVTVSYEPATPADQTTINDYAEQYATSIPAYLVQFKPVLKIEGITIATGPSIGMGAAQNLTVSITSPSNTENLTHGLLAGDYTAIGLNPSKISLDALNNRVNKNDFSEPVGEMLHQTALSYWAEADAFNSITAKTLHVNNLRHPSELAASAKVSVSYVYGVPSSATYNRRNIDVKLDNQTVKTKSTDKSKEISYMQQSGTTSSFLEGATMDQLFGKDIGTGVSAVTSLQAANEQGIPIYKIDSANIAATLPKLQIEESIKAEITNAINAGLTVKISQTNITKNKWTGVGYIVANPVDGSGAYRISGGLNGSDDETEAETVAEIPAVPITGAAAFVVNTLSANGNIGLKVEGGLLVGFTVAPEVAAGLAVGAAEALAILMLIILVVLAIKSILDKLPPRYEKFRHYTKEEFAKLIWVTNEILAGVDRGDLILHGVYVSDLTIEPVTEYNRLQIATILRMPPPSEGSPDPARVAAYVDVMIDRNRVGLISFQIMYPHQYLYPHPVMWNDGVRIKFLGIGPFISTP